jgi:hypothetical protein
MNPRHRTILGKIVVCALLVTATMTATAQVGYKVTTADKAGVIAGVAVAGAAIGIGIYFAVHHGHSLRGCAVSGPNGLELQNRGDQQTYALAGAVASIKPGDQVRVSGKKQKTTAGDRLQFVVDTVTKDYGACTAGSATPQVAKKE